MEYLGIVCRIVGSIALFLYGMKLMSDGIQQTAGERMQKVISFMTGNRFMGVLTGLFITAIIQSSSATTVMVVSFVNAGLLSLEQSIGVIMGANIGTTITAWIVSLLGFSINPSTTALPAIGIGFVMQIFKWKHRDIGTVFMGFGFLFLGLSFLTQSMPAVHSDTFPFLTRISGQGLPSLIVGTGVGLVITLLAHSSSATTAIVMTMAQNSTINFPLAAAMILGANIGTTIDAAIAAIGTRTPAKRAALVHVLFNVIGSMWALILFRPLLWIVDAITPGTVSGTGITMHLAMLHTTFNLINTLLFFPFVKPFARLVSFLIKEKPAEQPEEVQSNYRLEYRSGTIQDTPELQIIRAEKEIRDMAGLAASMYATVSSALYTLPTLADTEKETFINTLIVTLEKQENYADEMRVELTRFLIECTRQQVSNRSENIVTQLLRIVADLEEMTDQCFTMSRLLERSVKKHLVFKHSEMEALRPYLGLVESFLTFVRERLGKPLNKEETVHARRQEKEIMNFKDKLHKMGRKRIEAGEDVRTELLFIDLVRIIEKLGDFCYNIAESMSHGERLPLHR
ncbi:MAG: Na/Pi cotransporter family protein [Spirochaetaceae bacterium]|jgi:phosphate:Na+ symporter|nr:Na/Pi cotransporter family protein [Spirochaetaceae bacterium]